MKTPLKFVLSTLAVATLVACGGGSDSTSTTAATTPAATTPSATTPATTTPATTTPAATTPTAAPTAAPTTAPSPTAAPTAAPTSAPATTPVASANECAPMVPKAGDSITLSTAVAGTTASTKQGYASATYLGKPALSVSTSTTVNGSTTTGTLTYVDPVTGVYLGADAAPATATTVVTYDPPDYEARVNTAVTTVGGTATVAVKVRQTGKSITDAFAAIGGGTALTMDYTYTITRNPNETVTTAAGAFANACKLLVNVKISNVKLEGNNGSNPLYASLFGTLSGAFSTPFDSTIWLTNKLIFPPKTVMVAGPTSSTTEVTAYTLAPR